MLSAKLKEAAGNSADATLYVDDVFSTWLYDGAGASQTITNGIDLAGQGGLVWIKQRNGPSAHNLRDTVRGNNYALNSALSNAQSSGWSSVFNFTSTGFAITGTNDQYNGSGGTYASWTFRKAAKFFDVVTYTGTGSARTIAHSLGVAPGMIIVKKTSSSVNSNWMVYQITQGSNSVGVLNLTDSFATSQPSFWNNTAPTSSVFSIGNNANVNESGQTYVAYLYAHDTSSTGIIQCGSFTTDGSGNATVNLGWEPQYVMVKSSSASGSWVLEDIMRGGFDMSVASGGTGTSVLLANSSVAEGTDGSTYNYPTSTGFQVKFNYASRTFIYMAIRRPNKPPTTGTQVFAPVTTTDDSTYSTTNFPVDMVMDLARTDSTLRGVKTRLTGNNAYLETNSTNTENSSTSLANTFQSNTGVAGGIAGSSNNLVIEAFARAPSFFDVVCYTGTGVATTQAHNLTVVPELMIVKRRSGVPSNWWVYVSSIGNTKYSELNSTATPSTSSTAWNNTTPTASVFSIGTGSQVNASAETYVAYLFATLAGISKVGSYTGNGTGQAIACGFGSGGARFVLIKRTDSLFTGGWYTFDSARGLTSGSSPYLLLNSTAAQVTGNNGVYASSGGFTLGATASTTTNINGASYIFLSVA
jgi:hypothetical protein